MVGGGGASLLLVFSGMSGLVVLLLALAAYGLYIALGTARSLRQAVDEYPDICRQDGLVILTDEWINQEHPAMRSQIMWTAITGHGDQ